VKNTHHILSKISALGRILVLIICCSGNIFSQSIPQNFITKLSDTSHFKVTLSPVDRLNSKSLDFSPCFFKDKIVFVSNRNSDNQFDKRVNAYAADLYSAKLENGIFSKPKLMPKNLNSKYWEGPAVFNEQSSKLFFSRNAQDENGRIKDQDGNTWMHIYEARLVDDKWLDVKPLRFNMDDVNSMHPTLNRDGNVMVFSRSEKAGSDNMDLFFATYDNGFWSEPKNLGASINTDYSEGYPFLKGDTLFFASNRTESRGGFDMYYSLYNSDKGRWEYAVPLPEPFNSFEDDFGLILSEDGTTGFFTSNRNKETKDDIYYFALNQFKPYSVEYLLSIVDADTKLPISKAGIYVFPLNEDGTLTNQNIFDTKLQSTGDSGFEMKYTKKAQVQLGDPQKLSNEAGEVKMEMITGKNYLVVVNSNEYDMGYKNISTDPNGIPFLQLLLSKKKTCRVVAGTVLDRKTNQPLSNVLLSLSTDASKKDSTFKSDANGKYTLCVPNENTYKLRVGKSGYLDFLSSVNLDEKHDAVALPDIYLEPFQSTIQTEKVDSGSVLTLENIYYDYNSAIIRKDAAQELEDLAFILKNYPKMEIELGAHTDSRGPDWANDKLSRLRAENAKTFLVQKGIEASRITTIGYGETKIKNKCTNDVKCTEKEHQENRRTEVKVLKLGNSKQ
jgi:outer membrane protein OmpA-like peptidoglycan-associated protein